jgi:capsid protein
VLFGPAGWIVAGAAAGGALATFDRGIKNKLLKELGENMTSDESALAVLVEEADWEKALGRMADKQLQGQVIVQEMVAEHLAAIEKLVDVPPTTEAVPEELAVVGEAVEAPAAETVPAEAPVAEAPAAEAPIVEEEQKPE